MTDGASTADRILDAAEALVQTRGFKGFSYAHVASELHVTTASLHYHYRGKGALGEALIARYAERFQAALAGIDETGDDAPQKLREYAGLYAEVLRGRRMCLCGILAAEYETLPEQMRREILGFFDANVVWLARVLDDGRAAGRLAFGGEGREVAAALLAGLEGAMLLARPYEDAARFDAAARRLLGALSPSH